jgi:RimJ/RimL family protein N-acetyltransferase
VNIIPLTLEGSWARLEPLGEEHVDDLVVAADEDEIWTWMPVRLKTADDIRSWMAAAHANQAKGTALPFAIIDRATGKAVGSTRYMDIQPANRGLEIGWTWLSKQVRRTSINTECKYLLLRHAFDDQGAIRVQLKTNARNERSRTAILRIGAQFEGILRQQMILPDGSYRDSAYYSIIDREWPEVKSRLERMLAGEPSAVVAGAG